MEENVKNIINGYKRKTFSIIDLEKEVKKTLVDDISPFFYKELANEIISLVEARIIKPLKSAKAYSRDPRIKNKYRKVKVELVDEKTLKKELLIGFHPKISTMYYLKNLDEYQDAKKKIQAISDFLHRCNEQEPFLSVNERSYKLFGEEKFLASLEGKKLLTKLELINEDLFCYETFEPFFHIGITRKENENILIVENKDTYFSIKKLFLEQVRVWDGIEFSMIIYGEGNKITKSYEYLDELQVPDDANLYYFGDFDREGIAIYQRLRKVSRRQLMTMKLFYEKMFENRKNRTGNEQRRHKEAIRDFFEENNFQMEKEMKAYLEEGKYVPQEAVHIEMLRRLANGASKAVQRN